MATLPVNTPDPEMKGGYPMNPDTVGLYADERGPSIRLVDGSRFFLLEPDPASIDPLVLAHSLSQLCRFTGHTTSFYSVAQHCVLVSHIVPPELAMAGLMHDASEAFIGDISRPLKDLLQEMAPEVVPLIEGDIHEVIAKRFGFSFPHDPAVKAADNIALATELRDVMPAAPEKLHGLPDPLPDRIEPLDPEAAAREFLFRYAEI